MATNWKKIKAEYLKGNTTYPELAQKYKLAEKTIRNRAYKEGWGKEKGQIRDEVATELHARVVRTRVNELEKLLDANEKMIDIMLAMVETAAGSPTATLFDKNGTLRNAESLSKTIQTLVANQRDLLKLPTLQQDMDRKAQLERQKEFNARLKLDRERWKAEQAEKAKAQSVQQGTVWQVEAPEGEPIDE